MERENKTECSSLAMLYHKIIFGLSYKNVFHSINADENKSAKKPFILFIKCCLSTVILSVNIFSTIPSLYSTNFKNHSLFIYK